MSTSDKVMINGELLMINWKKKANVMPNVLSSKCRNLCDYSRKVNNNVIF